MLYMLHIQCILYMLYILYVLYMLYKLDGTWKQGIEAGHGLIWNHFAKHTRNIFATNSNLFYRSSRVIPFCYESDNPYVSVAFRPSPWGL